MNLACLTPRLGMEDLSRLIPRQTATDSEVDRVRAMPMMVDSQIFGEILSNSYQVVSTPAIHPDVIDLTSILSGICCLRFYPQPRGAVSTLTSTGSPFSPPVVLVAH